MKLRLRYQILFLALVTLAVYYPTLSVPFNSLDDQLFVQRLLNEGPFTWQRHFAPGGLHDYYRPLLTLTFELDKYLGGLQEAFMHLLNVLLHLCNVLLVFFLARRFSVFTWQTSTILPLVAAALFSLHPLNSEAVNWIAGRSDLLACVFILLSMILLLSALESRSLYRGAASALLLLFGAMSKETALFLFPGVFWLLIWRPQRERPLWPQRWWLLGGHSAAVAGYFLLRWHAFQTDRGLSHTSQLIAQVTGPVAAPAVVSPEAVGFHLLDAAHTAIKVAGFYALKLFQPLPLNFAIHRVNDFYVVPGVILLIVFALCAWQRRPVAVFLLLCAGLGMSALAVLFTGLAWTPVAERYMYTVTAPFAIALVYGTGPALERACPRLQLPVIVLLLAAAGSATVSRNLIWQDNLTLYQDTVRKSPDFAPARNQLALALYAKGRNEEADDIMAALKMPEGQIASLNQAGLLARQGRYDEARRLLLERIGKHDDKEIRALELLIQITTTHLDTISDSAQRRRLLLDNVEWLKRLEKLTHGSFIWYRLGRTYLALEQRQEAQRCFAEAARLLPADSPYRAPAEKLARDLQR